MEKIASEYSGSEFLVTARVLCGDFDQKEVSDEAIDLGEDEDNPFLVDPSLPAASLEWAKGSHGKQFSSLISGNRIFSNYEAARQVPLMFVLTIMSTLVFGSYFNRTDKVRGDLEIYNDGFPQRDEVFDKIESVGQFVKAADLRSGNFWLRKANFSPSQSRLLIQT